MTETIVTEIATELGISTNIINKVLTLLSEGNTVHFLARYRKEQIGGVDEEIIRDIEKKYRYQENLKERKEVIKARILEQGMLTEELQNAIDTCDKLVQLEQIYEPYKSKKITKAKLAIQGGLEPLAKRILTKQKDLSIQEEAKAYINDTFTDVAAVIENVSYLVAQIMSETLNFRERVKKEILYSGVIETKARKKAEELDETKVYQNYYDFTRRITQLANHQILAINRAEKTKILQVKFIIADDKIHAIGEQIFTRKFAPVDVTNFILECIDDALKRLVLPSLQREIRAELTARAEKDAIKLFGTNVYQLFMQKPLVKQTVLGFDPAFRTGCKLAIINAAGTVEAIDVIYPHEPKKQWKEAKTILDSLYEKYHFSIIAIGNGTASRESEAFVAEWIAERQNNVQYAIVSEAGASVYSASKLAIAEFPTYSVEQRSAVSIARRLLDPLSELVKIDPKSLGVGQYQHDLNAKELDDELTYVVDQAVNTVGVDVNIASQELLQYVSGLNKKVAQNIVDFRDEKGIFTSRKELTKVKGLGAKAFEQAAGFLRILSSENLFDNTSIHPESYQLAQQVLTTLGCQPQDIGTPTIKQAVTEHKNELQPEQFDTDKYTLANILDAFMNPLRDERDKFSAPKLQSNVTTLEDLAIGMELEGVVRNITDFGAFIDIGLKNDGFVHISKIAPRFIKHPSEELSIGENRTVYIENIYYDKNKVELSMFQK